MCSLNARLQVTLGLDPERDRCEWERLQLPEISIDYIGAVLAKRYLLAGFRITDVKAGLLPELQIQTSWSRRLQGSPSRSLIRIIAEAA